jgi:RNA polymerase sigma-70 factor (ECF subfamily)
MDQNYSVSKELPLDGELMFTLRNSSTLKQKVTKVFEVLRDPVYRYLFRVLDNAEEAEDLTQEVFLRLYSHLHKGQAVGNIRGWVFRVAHNLAVDQQRKKAPIDSFGPANWDQTQDPAPGAEQRILEKEQHRRLKRALAQLSSQEKQCLELRAEGLSYQEIAEILEMRLPTLVKYLGRIIKKLVREVTYD